MSTPRPGNNSAPDQRLLVLLAVGMAICLFRVMPGIFLYVEKGQSRVPARPPVYYWLAGEGLSEGLYRIEPALLADPRQASFHGLTDLSAPGETVSNPIPAFRLKTNGPAAIEEAPSGLAPFFFAPIAVNRADRELLMTLPGIGPYLADAIIAFRQDRKRIKALHELLNVKGIGKARLAALEGQLAFD